MVEVVPAIIPESFENLVAQVEQVRSLVSGVQIDVMDGVFAPTISWPLNGADEKFQERLDAEDGLPNHESLKYEIDLMVLKPEKMIDDWMRLGVKSMIIHWGSTDILDEIITEAHERNVQVGIAFKPNMGLDEMCQLIDTFRPDFIQLMGNDTIGFHGVALDERVYEQARRLREKFPKVTIGVDIGVNKDTAPKLVVSGVTKLVSGSSIFNADNIQEAVNYFSKL
jgi:ribulose-phosphate 3-epimerase